jgi:hypothetical protein
MSDQTPEARLANLEMKHAKLLKFCVGTLLIKLHQLNKNTAHNLGDLARAIKEPERFDLEGYLKQLDRAGVEFDQMDAALDEALKRLNGTDQQSPSAGSSDSPRVPPV